jgi:hypothetical protein
MSFQSIMSSISAHKFTISVPNLVWDLSFSLSTTLVIKWIIMHIISLKVISGRTNLALANLYK